VSAGAEIPKTIFYPKTKIIWINMNKDEKLMHDAAIMAWITEDEEKKKKRKKASFYASYLEEEEYQLPAPLWKRKSFLDKYECRE
jgi:hypothetical protein